MMRREILESIFYRSFNVGCALSDRARTGLLANGDGPDLIESVEGRSVGSERNVTPVVRFARIVCLLNPFNTRLDIRRQDALRNIEEIHYGNEGARTIDDRLCQRHGEQRNDR